MTKICGIDDAGRGPVLASMVLAGVIFPEEEADWLKNSDIKDSKLLTRKKREELYKIIKEKSSGFDIQVISPGEIDSREDVGLNLNDLEAKKAAEIINILEPDIAIIDCPSNNIPAWTEKVRGFLTHKCELIVEHKADQNHKVVGAASILAKCTRDAEIDDIQKSIDVPIGSGYASDPITQKFIKEYHDKYPDIFRKSWATYQSLIEAKKNKTLDDF